MKEFQLFRCEICGNTSDDKDKILKCEKSHLKVKTVSDPIYTKTDAKCEYPESVLVTFEGGKSARYHRKGH